MKGSTPPCRSHRTSCHGSTEPGEDHTDGYGWKPGDAPFTIDWLTPHTDMIEIAVAIPALPDFIAAVLPYLDDSYENPEIYGIRGLRPSFIVGGIELTRLQLPGRIRLLNVTRHQWLTAAAVAADEYGIRDEHAVWRTHPDDWHPDEHAFARRYDTEYGGNNHARDRTLAPLGSALLRRHLLLRVPEVNSISLWENPGSIQLEWSDGPDHAAVICALTDPTFGIMATTHRGCWCSTTGDCYAIKLTPHDYPDAHVSLRRDAAGWSPWREQTSDGSRARRRQALAHHRNSGHQLHSGKRSDHQPDAPTSGHPLAGNEEI